VFSTKENKYSTSKFSFGNLEIPQKRGQNSGDSGRNPEHWHVFVKQ
jgi:hypothetical protein